MSRRKIIAEEASIVLVGGFNPKIFHPEWFIRKDIVDDWDYQSDKNIISSHEYARAALPGKITTQVLVNQFSVKTPLESEFPQIKDIAINTFTILAETPLQQLGMNYQLTVHFQDLEDWSSFGVDLAPRDIWREAAQLGEGLDPELEHQLGLWDLTMNLPRQDDLLGYIRPRINVINDRERILSFSVNNHVALDDKTTVTSVLTKHWDESLDQAARLIRKILGSEISKG